MTSIFLDSNIWLRLFLRDEENQYQSCHNLLTQINEGYLQPSTSTIVFLEVNYVLRSFYKLTHEKTLLYLSNIKETRNITVYEETDLNRALAYYKDFKLKFTDCLIASQLKKGITLLTFDNEFRKLKDINSQTPSEFLRSFMKNSGTGVE